MANIAQKVWVEVCGAVRDYTHSKALPKCVKKLERVDRRKPSEQAQIVHQKQGLKLFLTVILLLSLYFPFLVPTDGQVTTVHVTVQGSNGLA